MRTLMIAAILGLAAGCGGETFTIDDRNASGADTPNADINLDGEAPDDMDPLPTQ